MSKHASPLGAVSPKVALPALVVLALTAAATFLAGVTPDMLAALGPWGLPLALAAAVTAQTITGYLKADPARVDLSNDVQALPAPVPVGDFADEAVASVQAAD